MRLSPSSSFSFVLVSALAFCASPTRVDAGGFALPLHGVRALATGGASFASAEGVDALWYNPSLIDETSVSLELSLIDLDARFTPSSNVHRVDSVTNSASPIPNPSLGASWRINKTLSFALGAYAPWSAQASYPEEGPQRYALVQMHRSKMLHMHAAAALHFGDLSVGAGIQNVYAHVHQRVVLSGYTGLFGSATDETLDILSELELKDPVTITANFGASYSLGTVKFGAGLQLPYSVAGTAKFRNRLPSSVFFDGASLQGDEAFLEIPFPLIAHGGLKWRPLQRWSIEAGVRFETWSVQQTLKIDPKGRVILHGVPAVGDFVLKPILIDRRMQDTLSIHAGTDVEVTVGLHLRAGFFYEPSSFPDETFSVALLDDEKVALSAGLSWFVGDFRLDLAASHIMQNERNVTSSALKQVNPTNPEQAVVIGNGRYESSMWLGGAALSWFPPQS